MTTKHQAILIAGCGYVGGALARLLVEQGHSDVYALRRSPGLIPEGATPILLDLLDGQSLTKRLPSGLDAVVYCAAPGTHDAAAYEAIYVKALQRLTEAIQTTSPGARVLLTSSTGVYPQHAGEWVDEESPAQPPTGSAPALLREGEQWLQGALGAQAVILRLSGIYGPGRDRLPRQVLSGQAVRYDRPLYTNRIHRDDCAGAIAHLLKLPNPQPLYIGTDEEPADWSDVMTWLAKRLGVEVPPVVAFEGSASARQQRSHKRCTSRRLRESGFSLKYKTFREGYEAIIAGQRGAEEGPSREVKGAM